MSTNPRHYRTVTISTSPQIVAALERLRDTGLFGLSRAKVAERFVCDGVRAAQLAGFLGPLPKPRKVRR